MRTLVVLLLVSFVLMRCSERTDPGLAGAALEGEILILVNQHRNSKSLPSLALNEVISEEARIHSQNMANGTTSFSHDGFSERIGRIKTAIGDGASGENIANGQKTEQAVMNSWLSSPGHKANIEGNFDLIGIGVASVGDGPLFYTQIFLKE